MTVLHLLPLACLALGAALVLRPVPTLRQARRTATAVSVAALLVFICVETLAWGGSPLPTFARPYVALILLVNLVAVGMTPLTRGLERWLFARMLVVSGSSGAMVLLSEAWVVAGLWCLQSVLVFGDVRRRVGLGRVFLAYQALSCLALLVALVLGDVVGWRAAVLPLLIAVAIREAIVPFHSWLPRLFERAPMGLVVVYAAPQLGVWLHLAWLNGHLDPALMARVAQFGAFTALVAALLGVFQNNPRRAVAYLFMSQSGLLTFGIESHSSISSNGHPAGVDGSGPGDDRLGHAPCRSRGSPRASAAEHSFGQPAGDPALGGCLPGVGARQRGTSGKPWLRV